MLPLWIIDLREKSPRRACFEQLVGRIAHVRMANRDTEQLDRPDGLTDIKGNYWRYSCLDDRFYGICIYDDCTEKQAEYDESHVRFHLEENPTADSTARRLYQFQTDLVEEGQAFIKELRQSNVKPDLKINIVVLGDLTESFTRIVFPSVARIIQKEKGRILPHHIHQGIEIVGMMFIPSDTNTRKPDLRKSMLRTLEEIDVQHCVNDMRGYDHMMYYQDVQNRTECAFPLMTDEQVAQYLLQCLVHLYLACNETHPLLSGTTAADQFYFSMGVASLFYDAGNECINAQNTLARDFIANLKSNGLGEKKDNRLTLLDEDQYSPYVILDSKDVLEKLSDDEIVEVEKPSPHPYTDFWRRKLKRYYYDLYLRYFSTNLMHDIHSRVEGCTRKALESVAINSKKRYTDAQRIILDRLDTIIGGLSAHDGGIPTVSYLFKSMQEQLSRQRQDIIPALKQKYWKEIERTHVARELRDRFEVYHDAYMVDLKSKGAGTNQLKVKKETMKQLNGLLSQESTLLSMLGRAVLLSITLVLSLVPLLCLISPRIIDLGNVRRYSEIWSAAVFCIPFFVQAINFGLYQRRKRKMVNDLKAIYLHDAYARVANRMESEVNLFYDRMIDLGDCYIKRCSQIQEEIGPDYEGAQNYDQIFPLTMFNQPLVGGNFGGKVIIEESEFDDIDVNINYIRYKLHELTPVEHFLFINQNKKLVMELFKDVRVTENLVRRVDENGKDQLLTKTQQEKELQELWLAHKEAFYKNLRQTACDSVNIYENDTVGEKLFHYAKTKDESCLDGMIAYAASNGEVTSSADTEYIDVKVNERRMKEILLPYFASKLRQFQPDSGNMVYQKYMFVTRWRSFEHFIFNRILPVEDFDIEVRNAIVTKDKSEHIYHSRPSSLMLWALSPYDSSSEWFRLFHTQDFEQAYRDKNIYKEILNQND